jgi:chromosome segregation ATPase
MDTETSDTNTPAKEDLETEKLRLEIADLKKRWWKRPVYIAALFPTLLALTTLIYGFSNGYFQAASERIKAENVKLENQQHDLKKEVEAFIAQKLEIEGQLKILSGRLEEANKIIEQAEEVKNNQQDMIHFRANEIHRCEEELKALKEQK